MIVTCKHCGAESKYTMEEILSCYKISGNIRFVEEFTRSGLERVEIDPSRFKTLDSCYHTFIKAVKPFRKYGIRVRQRHNRVYLVNENLTTGVNWYA